MCGNLQFGAVVLGYIRCQGMVHLFRFNLEIKSYTSGSKHVHYIIAAYDMRTYIMPRAILMAPTEVQIRVAYGYLAINFGISYV